jgi:prevent-host-death family protein
MATWQLQTAKAKLSELLRAVRDEGPQTISVRGKEEYVVSLKAPETGAARTKTGLDLFRPVLGLGVSLDLPHRDPDDRELFVFEDDETDFTGKR